MPLIYDEEPLPSTGEESTIAALGDETPRDRNEALSPLRVSIAHGNLRQAHYPLLVGHYYGDAIVSAEAFLDRQLGGRLLERFRMDLYPGPEGTVEVIHAPGCFPPGALIIGLGEVGTLTPEKIRRGVTEVALRHALAILEQRFPASQETWRSAAFSAILLGIQGGTISLDNSIAAIVQGAIEANRVLRLQGLWERVRIDAVEFVEIYEDIAIQAIHAATTLKERLDADLEDDESIEVLPYLLILEGGRFQRPASPYLSGWWRRLQITRRQNEDGGGATAGLHFLTLTDRARAEETVRATQLPLINQLIEQAVQSPVYNKNLASTLFELLVPNIVKEQTKDEADLVLILDSEAAQYPWELMAARTRKDVRPLATSVGIIRQFRTSEYRRNPQPPRGQNALVLGDTESGYEDLPGAQAEAEHVAQVLQGEGYEVSKIIKGEAPTIVSELFAKEYKIIHLAGHGLYNPEDPLKSGVVLGDNMFLTTAELGQLRVTPELVFINCCHLGRIDAALRVKSPHRMAASIAQELINIGVRAVIATGWAVNDEAAATFAVTFYKAILAGQPFGNAVTLARKTVFDKHQDTNTWGAYQCYGNPGFILVQEPEIIARKARRYFSRREYLDELKSIAADARTGQAEPRETLRQDLKRLDEVIPPHFRDGEVLAAFARAWAEVGDFNEAIKTYRKAILESKSGAVLGTIEQLANLQDRYASRLRAERQLQASTTAVENAAQDLPDPDELINEAIEWLEWLRKKLGDTTERLSLLGALYKRLALATMGRTRALKLKKAKEYYGKAHENVLKETDSLDPYPTLNWLTLRFCLKDRNKEELLHLIDETKKVVKEREQRQEATFWDRVGLPDTTLLRHLIKGDLARHEQEVTELYRRVIASGPTERELSSVRNNLDFLIAMLDARENNTVKALRNIKATLGM
jgi:CHAT domain-containing protein